MTQQAAQPVVRRDGNNLFVLEEGEYCCVCKETEWDKLEWFQLGGGDPDNPLKYTACKDCLASDKFHHYLVAQFEEALASQPDRWRKNPDETWSELCAHCGGVLSARTRECGDCHQVRED